MSMTSTLAQTLRKGATVTSATISNPPLSRSIYARPVGSRPTTREARDERRRRTARRLQGQLSGRPPTELDRVPPMQAILQHLRLEDGDGRALEAVVEAVREEVCALETWAKARPRRERASGAAIRRALELLRGFARLAALDFEPVPPEARSTLVDWLALEHRWCYAAAGTDRATFKEVTGRTGAR